jgi:hypothetical protein
VFQQWEKNEILLNSGFSSIGKKNGENEENIVEQWCFSNRKKKFEMLLSSGVLAMGKMGKMRKILLRNGV